MKKIDLEVIENILVLISNLSQDTDEETFAFLADLFDELYKRKKEQFKSDTTP